MRAVVQQEPLAVAVGQMALHYAARPQQPIYGAVRLVVKGGLLRLAAFDGETTARARLDVDAGEEGVAAVSGAFLTKWVKALPAGEVTIETADQHLAITAGSTRLGMPLLPAQDFPTLPTLPPAVAKVDGAALAAAVRTVTTASDADGSSGLPALRAMRVEVTPEQIRLVATDRTRVHLADIDAEGLVEEAVLHPAVGRAMAALPTLRGEVTLYASAGLWGASDDSALLITPQIALESWTKYERVVYAEWPTTLTVEADVLAAALRRAMIGFAGNERPIVGLLVGPESTSMQIRHESQVFSEEFASSMEGEPPTGVVGINARLLLDAIAHVKADVLRLGISAGAMGVAGEDPDRLATVALVRWRI